MDDIGTLRQLYEERRLDAAWTEYMRLTGKGPVGAEGHLLGALVALKLGCHQEARLAIDRASACEPTGALLAKVRFTGGIIAREYGDNALTIDELNACLALLDGLPEVADLLRGPALYNMALALQADPAKSANAIQMYMRAVDEFARTGMDDYRRQALQNVAWVTAEAGDADTAARLLDAASGLCHSDHSRWMQQIAQTYVRCRQGNWLDTARTCEAILQATAPDDVHCLATAIAAEALLRQGHTANAEVVAGQAVTLSLRLTDSRCRRYATRIHTEAKRALAGAR